MKLKSTLILGISMMTTGCIAPPSSYYFDSNSIPSKVYNKYWAMHPQGNVANVMEIKPNGTATIWRYSCDKLNNYRTKNEGTLGRMIEQIDSNTPEGELARSFVDVERYKIETVGPNEFKLHAIIVGGWSSIRIEGVNSRQLAVTQSFFGGWAGSKQFTYQQVPSYIKPLCAY